MKVCFVHWLKIFVGGLFLIKIFLALALEAVWVVSSCIKKCLFKAIQFKVSRSPIALQVTITLRNSNLPNFLNPSKCSRLYAIKKAGSHRLSFINYNVLKVSVSKSRVSRLLTANCGPPTDSNYSSLPKTLHYSSCPAYSEE